jgi:signal-transduction protein with cAMP-binding, CBS, and nucleotidyltransferase domain
MVASMRAVDNDEFIVTRLFRGTDPSSIAIRKSMRLVWTKRGEIVQSQDHRLKELIVLYHGTASGIRQTANKQLQRVVQLASGQVFGFIEMILDVPSLLTLSMESEGTVLMLAVDQFISLMKSDETLLWNVMYETLTEINRISLFIQAAPFPKVQKKTSLFVFFFFFLFFFERKLKGCSNASFGA